jgi:hypothetical protein
MLGSRDSKIVITTLFKDNTSYYLMYLCLTYTAVSLLPPE